MRADEAATNIRILVLDVDGVLTDGGLHYGPEGDISKRFHVQDGLGIKVAQRAGLEIAVMTGLEHGGVTARVAELGITEYVCGHVKKLPHLHEMAERRGITLTEVAYLGDDWVDAGPMRSVGLPMAVADARPEILELAAWVSSRKGGHGAVREAIDYILRSQGLLQHAWEEWTGP
ncbi:KdsC family phosphatase [Desulfohalovibrio reitneri]|uniref:KdsC family phosphatase n=1 Tax=Desulfohalovibrio reitneri TaxID=1307759 RepID=UPI0004A6D3CE|nr:HAD hydrolase family protein [Desulfohalovibrio reitneri]